MVRTPALRRQILGVERCVGSCSASHPLPDNRGNGPHETAENAAPVGFNSRGIGMAEQRVVHFQYTKTATTLGDRQAQQRQRAAAERRCDVPGEHQRRQRIYGLDRVPQHTVALPCILKQHTTGYGAKPHTAACRAHTIGCRPPLLDVRSQTQPCRLAGQPKSPCESRLLARGKRCSGDGRGLSTAARCGPDQIGANQRRLPMRLPAPARRSLPRPQASAALRSWGRRAAVLKHPASTPARLHRQPRHPQGHQQQTRRLGHRRRHQAHRHQDRVVVAHLVDEFAVGMHHVVGQTASVAQVG